MNAKLLNYLLDKYGYHMRIKELAAELKISVNGLRNKIYTGKFEVATWKPPTGSMIASTEEFAEYLSAQEEQAKKNHQELRKNLNL